MTYRLTAPWRRLSLAQRFALISLLVLAAGMWAVGRWVSEKIAAGVIQNSAVTAALYLNSMVAPEVQELARQDYLSTATIAVLDRLHRDTPLHTQIMSFTIWGADGRVFYASNPALIHRVLPTSPGIEQAWSGAVKADFPDLDYALKLVASGAGTALLEIYTPVRERRGDRVIAVAEFYQIANDLTRQIAQARAQSWLVVAGVALVMFALLFGIVRGGSRTIVHQQQELRAQVRQLSDLLAQNQALNERVRGATSRALELNERFLRRVSAELHDGPAQALGLGLLRLDAVHEVVGNGAAGEAQTAQARHDLETLRASLNDALADIRNLSAGLAVPELAELTLSQSLRRVIRAHRRRTGTDVELRLDGVREDLSLPLKIGVYRFVQEALNNAYRHGGGQAQRVQTRLAGNTLEVEVSDGGPGFDPAQPAFPDDQLGLLGMRERIESLGGHFHLESAPGQGTRVVARLPLGVAAVEHV